jgi:6-hydroxynicotinate 3-monooxygenase
MDRNTRIAVVGAGLGGMTVAGFLQRAGFDVTIYEQAPAFSRIGAGIMLGANVTKVLRRLGVEQLVVETGIKADCYISRAWDTGETLYEIAYDAVNEARFGGPCVNIHRGDLHAVLEKGVKPGTIAFNHRLVALDETPDATRLRFENGATVDADVVIGADGVNSRVREQLFGPGPPRFIGAVAYRAIFPTELLRGFKIPDCTKWWGPDRHLLVYFLTSRRDEVYVIGVVPRATWDTDAASLPGSREELFAEFGAYHSDLLRVLEVTQNVTVWPIFDRERNDRWTGGRIVLLGDSCHPMRPFMAAGGAMAIEDAAVLSRCLAGFDRLDEACRHYEATRVDRVGDTQRISIENSWMRGPTDTDWLYCYDPCVAPFAKPASPKPSDVRPAGAQPAPARPARVE